MFLLTIPEEGTGEAQQFTAAHYRSRHLLRAWLWDQCNQVNAALNATPPEHFPEEQLLRIREHVLSLAWCAYALDHS